MPRAVEVFQQVREAQAALGRGEVDGAIEDARRLLPQAVSLAADSSLTSFERRHASAACTFATITLILGAAESRPPAESIPAIRRLAVDAVRGGWLESWKALGAAAEMLARSGDAAGAVWAVTTAARLAPKEDYVVRLQGSIRSMYPQAFADADDPPPQEPPPLAASP